jgi:hypothetical protein
MTKISRPFQIALVAVVLLAAVYFVALRKHSSSSESSAPTPVASTATPSAASSASTASGSGTSASSSSAVSPSSGASGSGTSTYKGSAPGVDGLTRAIQKARGAVSESEQNAKALQQKATAASGRTENLGSSATGTAGTAGTAAAATGGTAVAKHSAATTHTASSAAAAVKAKSKTPAPKTNATKTASGVPVMQARVERELKRGDVAALLFWNPSGAVDKTVRRELQATARKLHGKLAISVARSSAVGSFGTFTRTVQVYGTPTILLINPAGKTVSLTGLTDVFSLEQAVREIKHSK